MYYVCDENLILPVDMSSTFFVLVIAGGTTGASQTGDRSMRQCCFMELPSLPPIFPCSKVKKLKLGYS
ncbi:hypothetical protein IQ276_023390 [Desmonostoc muscorum LEGE 12446]|nr:hypothetical protein [Desmonostoc muscorum]MCF2149319.1 hypothetical protein [Desmonostoc muscorum LEGE 12446]